MTVFTRNYGLDDAERIGLREFYFYFEAMC